MASSLVASGPGTSGSRVAWQPGKNADRRHLSRREILSNLSDMKTILHTVDIAAGPSIVYESLTTERGLSGWWSTRVSAETEVGGRVRFTFIEVFNPVMEILELEPDRLVRWRCIDGHEPWTDNTFRFEIEARGERSVLFFRQEYAQELSDEEYGTYNFNWGYYLHSLKQLCETGEGTPHQPEEGDG